MGRMVPHHEGPPAPKPVGWRWGNIGRKVGSNGWKAVLDSMQAISPTGELVKNAGAISWSDVDSGEAALIERCSRGDQSACAELVSAHQRMVFGLAVHLLGDRDEALDL